MLVRVSPAIAAICMVSSAALAQGASTPTDPQIAHIAYTAGQLDIEAAKQALSKSKNKDVRAFAEGMVSDHTAVNKKALDLVKKLKVTPEDNDTSRARTCAPKDRSCSAQESPERDEGPARHKILSQTEHFPLDRVNDAIAHLKAGKARYRIVLDM
jgi:putative membrane protein